MPDFGDIKLVFDAICTSSPLASTAQSTGSRLTYVPLRLPTSTIWNSPLTHRNSAAGG